MVKSAIDFGIKILICLLAFFSLSTCGIEEYYELPQVSSVIQIFNISAEIVAPPIDSYYYARGYQIYYRIYLSSQNVATVTVDEMNGVNTTLDKDYSFFEPYAKPSETTYVTSISTFSGRNYYELNYAIDEYGGKFIIDFPSSDIPTITFNNASPLPLLRNKDVRYPSNYHEKHFINTSGLNEDRNVSEWINIDVASGEKGFAYAAMYIVAIGQNPTSFSTIFGKPTFINVFKLPNS